MIKLCDKVQEDYSQRYSYSHFSATVKISPVIATALVIVQGTATVLFIDATTATSQ
jgi:hypothetical protein